LKIKTQITMKYILDIPENKSAFAVEFFNSISFVKKVTPVLPNEITNYSVLKSIEEYESKKTVPTPLSLEDLKIYINA
jgi:hypothetical protein